MTSLSDPNPTTQVNLYLFFLYFSINFYLLGVNFICYRLISPKFHAVKFLTRAEYQAYLNTFCSFSYIIQGILGSTEKPGIITLGCRLMSYLMLFLQIKPTGTLMHGKVKLLNMHRMISQMAAQV